MVYLRDPQGFAREGVALPLHVFQLMLFFDGTRSPEEVGRAFTEASGVPIDASQVAELAASLDDAYLLDSERFHSHRDTQIKAYREATVRPVAHAGVSYPEDPDVLRTLIDGFFTDAAGPGRPGPRNGTSVVGLIAPHIDFGRGGLAFAWAYRQLAEAKRADVYIVLGTGHSSRALYTSSRKTWETPFGPLPADLALIDAIEARTSDDLFVDEYAHRSEHSIEFQAIFLKYLFPNDSITFVPILCGSFYPAVEADVSPRELNGVSEMIVALKDAVAEDGRDITFIAGVDFSHVGRQFGDEAYVDEVFASRVEKTDQDLIDAASRCDGERFFQGIRQERDQYRVCGTSSIYTILEVLNDVQGRLLVYDRAIDEGGNSLVSFASMVFEGESG